MLRRAATSATALGVAGGDGTINCAAQVAADSGKPLAVVPSGTLNHFARDLGIGSLEDAVSAVRSGSTVAVDVAAIDDRVFVNTASFGGYVDLVDARTRLERRIGKWPAVAVAVVQVLRGARPVRVELDGRRTEVWMIFIGNCAYHPTGLAPSWRERLDDGRLDVRVVDGTQPWARTRLVVSALTGTLASSGVFRRFTTRQLHVRSLEGPLRLARDGETFDGGAEFTVRKCDRPLTLYAPEPVAP